jgi:hypothetical protein
LRKYLIVAIAALTSLAFATTALAQVSAPSMKVSITPKKAGTKQKPKNSQIDLTITNPDKQRTLGKLVITSPKTFILSAKGLTACKQATLVASGPSGCPKKSIVGHGTADATAGVNTASPFPVTFDVTAVVLGAKKLGFNLHTPVLANDIVSPGAIKGNKLTITVPPQAQQPAPGLWAGLNSLHTTLKGSVGKHYLASTNGCKSKKHKFSATLTFVDNTVPGTAGTEHANASSKCSGK